VFLADWKRPVSHSPPSRIQRSLRKSAACVYVGMTRAMNTLILTRAHYRRRYGNDAPEMSVPSRCLEEVPSQLIENLGGRSPAWSTPAYGGGYGAGRRAALPHERLRRQHYNYETRARKLSTHPPRQKASGSKPFVASWMKPRSLP